MRLARLPNDPSALADFFQEGLETLGAVCERTWHDRLHLIAESRAAQLWNSDGALVETEVHFLAPGDSSSRHADKDVFPGCPLTFRLAEELRPTPLVVERAILQPFDLSKPPALEVAEKLWLSQVPGASRWHLERIFQPGWHFSLLTLARCEIQAIDQHWTLHRIAISLHDGERDELLASKFDFAQATTQFSPPIDWPPLAMDRCQAWLKAAFSQELESDLADIRQRQQRYLARELERIDSYFENYEQELNERQQRSHSETTKIKTQERLAAAKSEHAHRREDQIRRHEIRVIPHLDALVLLAEPAWEAQVSFTHKNENRQVQARFLPRSRRWLVGAMGA